MSKSKSLIRKIPWVMVLLFFGIIIFGNLLKSHDNTDTRENKNIAHLPYKTLYKTIPDSQNAIGLIGYELHEDGQYSDGNETYPTYSAIVKNIDNQKDNYKSLCRDVISDVIKTCCDKRVIVNVYDSFEAYTLVISEETQQKFLSNEEQEIINHHLVALYEYTNDYDGEICSLTFYPVANNGLTEKEEDVHLD